MLGSFSLFGRWSCLPTYRLTSTNLCALVYVGCFFSNLLHFLSPSIILSHVWNALWYFVLYFSACGTRSGVLCYIFLRVERALVFCVIFSLMWNALWCFVLYIFRVWNALWYFVLYILRLWNPHWYLVLYFSACGTKIGVFCYIFSACGTCSVILCYIFLRVERALVFSVVFFCMQNVLLLLFNCFFSPCLKLYLIYSNF